MLKPSSTSFSYLASSRPHLTWQVCWGQVASYQNVDLGHGKQFRMSTARYYVVDYNALKGYQDIAEEEVKFY
jgi:hypothetical protein